MMNDNKVVRLYGIYDTDKKTRQAGGVYDKEAICPTIDTGGGGWRQPLIEEIDMEETAVACAIRGRGENNTQQLEISDREKANSITTVAKDSLVSFNYRVRKLTPRECYRLMGFTDGDFDKAEAVNSNTQLYSQAGNSIVVQVMEALFTSLIEQEFLDCQMKQ